jgi:hypothetical protein
MNKADVRRIILLGQGKEGRALCLAAPQLGQPEAILVMDFSWESG